MAVEPEPITILRVTIENFRGFRVAQTIDLGASATIVSGTNGKGKTSFFDALQWLLLGSVSRLANLANRRSGEYIVNRFAGAGSEAKVHADLWLDSRLVTLTRTGDHRRNLLEWTEKDHVLTGDDAEKALCNALLGDPEIPLRDTVLTSGILEQDVVRAVLEDEPRNRYRHMTMLLGLEEVAGFQEETKRQADELSRLANGARQEHAAADQRLRTSESDLARIEQRLASEPEVTKVRAQLTSKLVESAPSLMIEELPAQAADAVTLGQRARRIRTTADRLLSDDIKLREQETALSSVDAAELARVSESETRADQDRAEAERALAGARERKGTAERRASDLAELATRAIPLLGETCPVCNQAIDAGEVEVHLRELVTVGGEDLAALAQAAEAAEERMTILTATLDRLRVNRELMETQQRRNESVAAARQVWQQECKALAAEEDELLKTSVSDAVAAGAIDALQQLRASADQLTSITDELAALLSASSLTEEVERQRDLVRTLRESVGELSDQAARASRAAADASTLSEAATRAVAGVTNDRFASLQPLVNDIFSRLAPHPAFTALGFDMTVSYRSGVADPFVKDPETDVTGDPLLLFSSSQTNVAALTYFLALSWAAEERALPFLLLDDPLQSMDDVNALGFADLCRHIRRRRQLVVSTHETRLAGLLERKLTPRSSTTRTRLLRFTGWDRSGPTIEQVDVEPEAAQYLLKTG